ncbi:MAG: IPTL-CTERM sorting domain-containing protein [Planctomycetota bacterium]
MIVLVGDDVYVETAADSRSFAQTGTLPAADFPSFGAAFIRVSPDGTQIAVGNNGGTSFSNYQVGVFDVNSLMGNWFAANHFDAEWIDSAHIALTAGDFVNPSVVTVLDTTSAHPPSPTNTTIIDNIGGASGGIAFDSAGNLYTGNGFQTSGPSETGAVKAFLHAAWTAALTGGTPLDFEAGGVLVVDVLSASPLAFDRQGNLLVGGGDFSSSGDTDFVALVRASTVSSALSGMGPADSNNPEQVRRLDPDAANDFNYFSVNCDPALGRLYVHDSGSATLHTYMDVSIIPTLSQWGLASMTLLLLTAATLVIRRAENGGGQ